MTHPEKLRQEIEKILSQVYDDTNGNAPDELLALIDKARKEAAQNALVDWHLQPTRVADGMPTGEISMFIAARFPTQ